MLLYAVSGSSIVGMIATISLFVGILLVPLIIIIAMYQKKSEKVLEIDNDLIQKAILNTKSKVNEIKDKEAMVYTHNYLYLSMQKHNKRKKLK